MLSLDSWEIIRSSDTTVTSSLGATSVTQFGGSPTSIADAEPPELDLGTIIARGREIARKIQTAQISSIKRADEVLAELTKTEGYASYPLYYVAVTGEFRNDIRAVAARLFVCSLYAETFGHSRQQTRTELDSRTSQLLKHLVQSVPPLVRLGVLEGLEGANDFRMIRRLFAAERDAQLLELAAEALEEE